MPDPDMLDPDPDSEPDHHDVLSHSYLYIRPVFTGSYPRSGWIWIRTGSRYIGSGTELDPPNSWDIRSDPDLDPVHPYYKPKILGHREISHLLKGSETRSQA